MIKLTRTQGCERETVIRIEGRLDRETVHELESVVDAMRREGLVTLDLSGLTSVDHAGRSTLVRLRGAGSRVVGPSLYIRQLLQEA